MEFYLVALTFLLGVIGGTITAAIFMKPIVANRALDYVTTYFESRHFINDLLSYGVSDDEAYKIQQARLSQIDLDFYRGQPGG